MNKRIKKFTINGDDSIPTKGSMTFEVTDEHEQIEIIFQVSNSAWIQIFVKKDNIAIGEALLTHQQDKRIILVGKESLLTSPTITPQSSLLGNWEIIYMAKPHFSKACDAVIRIEEHLEGIVDIESDIDIFD